MCKEILDTLPEAYQSHFTTLWTEEHYSDHPPHTTLHPTVSLALKTKYNRIQEKPDDYQPPSVMFFDPQTQSYVHHEGTKAIQFLHTYVQDHHTNKLASQQHHVGTHSPVLKQSSDNLKKILDITTHQKSTISQELKQLIQTNTKSQLQNLYSSIHKIHVPMKK